MSDTTPKEQVYRGLSHAFLAALEGHSECGQYLGPILKLMLLVDPERSEPLVDTIALLGTRDSMIADGTLPKGGPNG